MEHPYLQIRDAGAKGRGVFARQAIGRGELIAVIEGWLAESNAIDVGWFALQVGPNLWICTNGDRSDDCINHSCDPNVGFATGATILHALRDIEAGEEICWDYSTSISEADWTLDDCCCGAVNCRGTVRAWFDLTNVERERLRPIALAYLR